ncbi:hypothetical protein LUZ60_000042 [Juncus effusus]|nr:hypothetical protein LUZ60_000042 [Juncus effusus]
MENKLSFQTEIINQNGNKKENENGIGKETGNEFIIRRLELSDHSKGFIELLRQLSTCPSLSESEFQARFAELAALGEDHYICVIEHPTLCHIIATGCLFIEKKFLRNCSAVGHIEDIVVDESARGARLGQRIVRHLVDRAREMGCYKVILDCEREKRGFYEKCGFEEKNVQMAIYF